MSYRLTPVRMVITNKTSVGEDAEKKAAQKTLGEKNKKEKKTLGENVNWYSHYGKEYGGFS